MGCSVSRLDPHAIIRAFLLMARSILTFSDTVASQLQRCSNYFLRNQNVQTIFRLHRLRVDLKITPKSARLGKQKKGCGGG